MTPRDQTSRALFSGRQRARHKRSRAPPAAALLDRRPVDALGVVRHRAAHVERRITVIIARLGRCQSCAATLAARSNKDAASSLDGVEDQLGLERIAACRVLRPPAGMPQPLMAVERLSPTGRRAPTGSTGR